MGHYSELIEQDVVAYLEQHEKKDLLRFITCGSVDDGKSTLIGRLLHDTKGVYEDHLAALEGDSQRYGTTGRGLDLALLVDGLQSEREQGITIDVAYRYFSTEKRKFIIADTPGHEQYTRNMATGASTAELAVVLVDATRGVLPQTKRHSTIVSLLGIRELVVAINKMDLLDFGQRRFEEIRAEYLAFIEALERQLGGSHAVRFIPISALDGDNVVQPSQRTPWHHGLTLLGALEDTVLRVDTHEGPLRFPVQYVNRPDAGFRGYCGTLASGHMRVGDDVLALPSRKRSKVASIVTYDSEPDAAIAPAAITVTLADELDIGRGDLLVHPNAAPSVGTDFEARVVWMHEDPLETGRPYLLKIASRYTGAVVRSIRERLDIDTLVAQDADRLGLNEIGHVHVALTTPTAFDAFAQQPTTGSFIFIDRVSNATLGAGMISRALRPPTVDKATNVVWQQTGVDKSQRATMKKQKPLVVWLTGLSGAGKSTIANRLEQTLTSMGHHTYLLDGDNMRHGLNKDLGFSDTDRIENIRRIGEVAKLFVDAGLIVITAFISPFRSDRRMVRELMSDGEFIEVFVDTPLEVAESRDPKGLYARARRGEIKNFTGIDSPYERPHRPELHIETTTGSIDEHVEKILHAITTR